MDFTETSKQCGEDLMVLESPNETKGSYVFNNNSCCVFARCLNDGDRQLSETVIQSEEFFFLILLKEKMR